MFVTELLEEVTKQIKVILPGRFQPWHKGHAAVFNHLCETYGKDNVYICTSNKVELPKSPFNFAEKVKMMALTGVNTDRVVLDPQPYRAETLTSQWNPSTTVLLFAVSEKDMAEDPRFRFTPKKDGSPSYFQHGDTKNKETFDKHAYIITVPTVDFEILGKPANSATQIRELFAKSDLATQRHIVTDLFGKFDNNIFNIMKARLEVPNNHVKEDRCEIKKPRKGSQKWLTQQKQKEWDRNHPPVEPIDQMYGNAKIIKPANTKEVTESVQRPDKWYLPQNIWHSAFTMVISSETELNESNVESQDSQIEPLSVELYQYMTPSKRQLAFDLLQSIRDRYGKEFSLKVWQHAAKLRSMVPAVHESVDSLESDNLDNDLTNPDPKIRSLAFAIDRMEKQLAQLNAVETNEAKIDNPVPVIESMLNYARNGNTDEVKKHIRTLAPLIHTSELVTESIEKALRIAKRNSRSERLDEVVQDQNWINVKNRIEVGLTDHYFKRLADKGVGRASQNGKFSIMTDEQIRPILGKLATYPGMVRKIKKEVGLNQQFYVRDFGTNVILGFARLSDNKNGELVLRLGTILTRLNSGEMERMNPEERSEIILSMAK